MNREFYKLTALEFLGRDPDMTTLLSKNDKERLEIQVV